MMKAPNRHTVDSISEQHRILSLPKPHHPLVSVFNFEDITYSPDARFSSLLMNLYCVAIKKNVQGKVKYGQHYYDFDEGVMSFFAPNQLITNITPDHKMTGWSLCFHPDFIRAHPLGKKIKEYSFFSYSVNEALHLSEKEENTVATLLQLIRQETETSIDHFSQDIVLSHIELLLNYANRFYNRQFITRKNAGNDLLTRFEELIDDYFKQETLEEKGLPNVQYFADNLHLSPNYLSDMLRSLTGKSTQQHIQEMIIEKAKELLSTTSLSVAEIAYIFGFEYPQSFNKLFKNKTKQTPLEYRQSFN